MHQRSISDVAADLHEQDEDEGGGDQRKGCVQRRRSAANDSLEP